MRTCGRDTGWFSAESWRSCSHTGPSSPPSAPASPSAGDKTRPLGAGASETTFLLSVFFIKRWQDKEHFYFRLKAIFAKYSHVRMYDRPTSHLRNCPHFLISCHDRFLPWCPGWRPSSLDLAVPAAWTQRHGSLHMGGLEVKRKRQIGTIFFLSHLCTLTFVLMKIKYI